MVVLRLGGVYADVDTECKLPLNEIILPKDTLIVSWENEFSTAEEARQRKYVRKRQVPPPPLTHKSRLSTSLGLKQAAFPGFAAQMSCPPQPYLSSYACMTASSWPWC